MWDAGVFTGILATRLNAHHFLTLMESFHLKFVLTGTEICICEQMVFIASVPSLKIRQRRISTESTFLTGETHEFSNLGAIQFEIHGLLTSSSTSAGYNS